MITLQDLTQGIGSDIMIIYKIENLINGKLYIGQTTRSIESRFLSHSQGDMIIGRAIRKYGIQSFKISVIDNAIDKQVLNEKEKYWIKKLNSLSPNGYNISIGGFGGNLGELVNKKIGDARRGRKHSKETIAKLTGRKHSKETIAKLTGRKNTEETIKKMRHPHKKMKDTSKMKKPKTEEHKRNIGLSSKGRKHPKLAELNRSRTGQKRSIETRKKMSDSRKQFIENKNKIVEKEVL
jgi:group I intron endonuclease